MPATLGKVAAKVLNKLARKTDSPLITLQTIVLATFTGADSAVTPGATADTGQAWTQRAGVWGRSSNRGFLATAAGTGNDVLDLDSGRADGVLTCDLCTDSLAEQRIIWRLIDINNFWLAQPEGTGIRVYKRVAGSFTSVATVGPASLATAITNIGVSYSGSGHQILIGGVAVGAPISDAFNQAATRIGIGTNGFISQRFDNFQFQG